MYSQVRKCPPRVSRSPYIYIYMLDEKEEKEEEGEEDEEGEEKEE